MANKKLIREWRHRLLTLGLMLILVMNPLFVTDFVTAVVLETAGATFLLGFISLMYRRRAMAIGGMLFGLTFMATVGFYFTGGNNDSHGTHHLVGVMSISLSILFLMYIAGVILRDVLTNPEVTLDTVFGAMCVYLMGGMLWANLFLLCFLFDRESFAGPGLQLLEGTVDSPKAIYDYASTFHYFSFETLTTLGYGDITPVKHFPRTLAWLEAACGQLYLAVMIARLVALETANQVERREARRREDAERE